MPLNALPHALTGRRSLTMLVPVLLALRRSESLGVPLVPVPFTVLSSLLCSLPFCVPFPSPPPLRQEVEEQDCDLVKLKSRTVTLCGAWPVSTLRGSQDSPDSTSPFPPQLNRPVPKLSTLCYAHAAPRQP
jgi:hypothetical protein